MQHSAHKKALKFIYLDLFLVSLSRMREEDFIQDTKIFRKIFSVLLSKIFLCGIRQLCHMKLLRGFGSLRSKNKRLASFRSLPLAISLNLTSNRPHLALVTQNVLLSLRVEFRGEIYRQKHTKSTSQENVRQWREKLVIF